MQEALFAVLIAVIAAASGAGFTYYFERRKDELRSLQEERVQLYDQFLQPFYAMWSKSNDRQKQQRELTRQITSVEYGRTSWRIMLFADDEVIWAYNAMMTEFYRNPASKGKETNVRKMRLMANLMLAIRRSHGMRGTRLKPDDMLRWKITDWDEYAKEVPVDTEQA